MTQLHIINPAAGNGLAGQVAAQKIPDGQAKYLTTGVGDAERIVIETCRSAPDTHFIVYGGDGTVQEAASGILKAGAGQTALLSVVPVGTGNDLLRTFPEQGKTHVIDALKCGDTYALNIVNFGFDSLVVEKTERYKKRFPGSAAYIFGLVDTLFHKIGQHWEIEIEDEHGKTETLSGEFTLALAANCRYYGGGFHAAPLADPKDGLIDFLAVKAVSRLTFLRLVGDYKKGTHFDPDTGTVREKFQSYVFFRRCKRVKFSGIGSFCADGEVRPAKQIEISVVPQALRLQT